MNSNIITIIQARMGSSRLPKKVMMPLSGRPLLYRMFERVAAAKLKGTIVIAATTEGDDEPIINLCRENDIQFYRGHPADLLDRHYRTASAYKADVVIKIPSDCPLIDPAVIDKVINYYINNKDKFDFVSNLHPATYPDGNDVEIMTMSALENAWKNAAEPMEREHTTPYFWDNPGKFRVGNVIWETGLDYSMTHRFTIDYAEDYEFIKAVYDELYSDDKIFTLEDVLDLLDRKPELKKINEKFAGVNWYRNHLNNLKTISSSQTKIL